MCGVGGAPVIRGHCDSVHCAVRELTTNMAAAILLLLLICFKNAHFIDPPCLIELKCAECMPDNMPLVTSHRAANGTVTAASGEQLTLACGGGKFLAYPQHETLVAVCEAGRYRVRHDHALKHLLDLGCQESVFEDVLHEVDECAPPLQGRAYMVRQANGGVRHAATLCYNPDAGLALRLHVVPRGAALPPHQHRAAPLSLLGNFEHMFDATTRHRAERLYSNDASLERRLHEMFKPDRVAFAGQTLTSAPLLAGGYFEDQEARVAEFASNRVAVWRSVAAGNLRHVQRDVARAAARGGLRVWAGALGVMALRTGRGATPVRLGAGGRFPVPRYVWTVVQEAASGRALALLVLNDPFVAVSEIRDAVFCTSTCSRVSWLREVLHNGNFETPLLGLTFCCSVRELRGHVPELPAQLLHVPEGDQGLLTHLAT